MRAKRQGQAIVEFGIIALLFTALMFAVVDFGLLLNTWLSVSSATREIGRNASVGKKVLFLKDETSHLNLPSVSTVGFAKACCDASSAIEVRVEYFTQLCPPWNPVCNPIGFSPAQPALISIDYPYGDVDHAGTGPVAAACGPPVNPLCHPQSDDLVRVTVVAHGAQVITPLLRPFFGCRNGVNPNCDVALTSKTIIRFEGQEF